MNIKKILFKDKALLAGVLLIILSFITYLAIVYSIRNGGSIEPFGESELYRYGILYTIFIVAVLYFIITLLIQIPKKKHKIWKYSHKYLICAIAIFSISCFTINIVIPIFYNFSTWVDIYLIMMHGSLIIFCYHDELPKSVRIINFFALGLTLMMSLYFAIFLLPLTHIAFMGFFFVLGLTVHLLVPAIMFFMLLTQFFLQSKLKLERLSFLAGVLIPLIVISIYFVKWNSMHKLIHEASATIITRPDNKLPTWVLLSQKLGNDFFTTRILKGDLSFETTMFGDAQMRRMSSGFDEDREHDPLVAICSEFMGEIEIPRSDRSKILASQFDLRHQSKRKLWSGQHLETSSVLTTTQVFPDYRLSYAEKIIDIKNTNNSFQIREEEALYTFHLPEGSVATSLSLWIEGVEEKSRLTTKSKASKAYTSIVGVERRDPSIMHWQEGNTITVYVFPCTPKEKRRFKIGITSPMKIEDDKLIVQNVYFEGPDVSDARETNVIEFISKEKMEVDLPSYFDETTTNKFIHEGSYKPYWEASCNKTNLPNSAFSFNGKSYTVEHLNPTLKKNNVETIYLDINKSWTSEEFEKIWSTIKEKKVYTYYDKLHELTDDNKEFLFDQLHELNFSLFPIDQIENANNSLLISKSTHSSPNLDDLKKSTFIKNTVSYLEHRQHKINMFNISDELSPYLKSLKEFQVFNYCEGETQELIDMLEKNLFAFVDVSENQVYIDCADLTITSTDTTLASEAPDHLLRLYAYNKIIKECGRKYFTDQEYVEDELISIANEAYIVSPISSLIVLETQKDYERFNIKENDNSLKNASTGGSGAVPEPHEWAIILMLSLTFIFLYSKK